MKAITLEKVAAWLKNRTAREELTPKGGLPTVIRLDRDGENVRKSCRTTSGKNGEGGGASSTPIRRERGIKLKKAPMPTEGSK